MIFGTCEKGVRQSIALILLLSLAAVFVYATGCGPFASQQVIPAHYDVRETENGVYIFEFNAGNQGTSNGDSLTMFTDSLNDFTKTHPELSVTRLERLSTTVNYKDTQNIARSVTVVNVLVYTGPSGKPTRPAPPKPEEKK